MSTLDPRRAKITQYETFLNEQLKPDLNSVLCERDEIYKEIAEYLALKNSLEAIDKAELRPGEPLKTKVDLGCNFYAEARVPDPNAVFIDVGLGFFVELDRKSALQYIGKKTAFLESKSEKLTDDACKIKANIKLTLEGLRELQYLTATASRK